MDQEVMRRLVCFLAFVESSSTDGAGILDRFKKFLGEGSEERICQELCQVYRERIESEMQNPYPARGNAPMPLQCFLSIPVNNRPRRRSGSSDT